MAFSIEEKVDLLLKKVAFGKTKTDRSENTDGFGESIASPLLLRGDKVMKDAGSIPSTPAATANVVAAYQGGDVVECTAATGTTDTNITGFKRAWTTGHTDWIPPEFSAAYTVEVYVGPTGWNGTDAVATTIGGTNGSGTGAQVFRVVPGVASANWYFDYQAGVLYWTNESGEPSGELTASQALTSSIASTDKVYIKGYKYIGNFGVGGTSDITGAASTIASANLTINRALISNGSGKVAVSTVTSTELAILGGLTATTSELNILDGVTSSTAELNILDGVTSSTAELNILDGVTANATELNILDGVTANATELNILDGLTSTTAELNILDGVTSSTAELNILDGVTASTAEINILDGVTSSTAELNLLDGVTSSTAELNILDGVTASTAELNILDGVTSSTAELNILDGVTANSSEINLLDGAVANTVVNGIAVIYGSSGEIAASSISTTGNVTIAGNLTVAGDVTQQNSTTVVFNDTFLDLNVANSASTYTTDSGFRFARKTSAANTLSENAALTYDASADQFKFTRHGDSSSGAVASADNVKALKFNMDTADSVSQTSQADDLATMPDDDFANAASARSLGAVAKCSITITNQTADSGSNFAPDIQGTNGYVIKHNLNTQSIYVIAIKDPSGTPIPIFCKYQPIDADSVRVTVGVTADNEVYDIIVIG